MGYFKLFPWWMVGTRKMFRKFTVSVALVFLSRRSFFETFQSFSSKAKLKGMKWRKGKLCSDLVTRGEKRGLKNRKHHFCVRLRTLHHLFHFDRTLFLFLLALFCFRFFVIYSHLNSCIERFQLLLWKTIFCTYFFLKTNQFPNGRKKKDISNMVEHI